MRDRPSENIILLQKKGKSFLCLTDRFRTVFEGVGGLPRAISVFYMQASRGGRSRGAPWIRVGGDRGRDRDRDREQGPGLRGNLAGKQTGINPAAINPCGAFPTIFQEYGFFARCVTCGTC